MPKFGACSAAAKVDAKSLVGASPVWLVVLGRAKPLEMARSWRKRGTRQLGAAVQGWGFASDGTHSSSEYGRAAILATRNERRVPNAFGEYRLSREGQPMSPLVELTREY